MTTANSLLDDIATIAELAITGAITPAEIATYAGIAAQLPVEEIASHPEFLSLCKDIETLPVTDVQFVVRLTAIILNMVQHA